MAAVTAAVAVGAGMAYSANRQGAAQKKAANAQASAAQQTLDKQASIYQDSVSQATPWLTAGQNALARQDAVLNGDYSGFESSPDYLYARQEMTQAGDRSAAARGGLYSGGYQADLAERIGGLASQNLGNYWNKLTGLSTQGQQQSQYLGQLGQGYGNQFANAMGIKGQADASRASATAGAQAGYGNALASAFSTYVGMGGGGGGGFNFGSLLGGNSGAGSGGASNPGSLANFGNNPNWYLGGSRGG